MLTQQGFRLFLEQIAKPYGCRLWSQGTRLEQIFPTDQGYPKIGDTDEANTNRGEYVLTWRFTIPKGTSWGQSPANEAELVHDSNVIYKTPIPDFRSSASHPTVLYINMMIRRS